MPTVMVSSTYYDLRQVRQDLQQFLVDDIGYACLLSEFSTFPVDPDLDTVENCKRRVEENADILVLLVGGRYGSVDKNANMSITNLEYITAHLKGIPVFVFVERRIIDTLPLYQSNPQSNFSSIVDTPRLFDFVVELREANRVWTFPFDSAQDIVGTLKIQFGHLFDRLLELRGRITGGNLPGYLERASPAVIKLWLEKPAGWDYRLLVQAWHDEIQKSVGLYREYKSGVRIGQAESIRTDSWAAWSRTRLRELEQLIQAADDLVNVSAAEALGPPGFPANIEQSIWVAETLGRTYREVLEWALRVRRAHVEEPFDNVADVLWTCADHVIESTTIFPVQTLQKVEEAIHSSGRNAQVQAVLRFDFAHGDELKRVMDQAMEVWERDH